LDGLGPYLATWVGPSNLDGLGPYPAHGLGHQILMARLSAFVGFHRHLPLSLLPPLKKKLSLLPFPKKKTYCLFHFLSVTMALPETRL
jgi:hypothetical protein